jgi:hypothetical protein
LPLSKVNKPKKVKCNSRRVFLYFTAFDKHRRKLTNIYKESLFSRVRKKMVIPPKIVDSEVLSIAPDDENEVDIDELTEGQEASFAD